MKVRLAGRLPSENGNSTLAKGFFLSGASFTTLSGYETFLRLMFVSLRSVFSFFIVFFECHCHTARKGWSSHRSLRAGAAFYNPSISTLRKRTDCIGIMCVACSLLCCGLKGGNVLDWVFMAGRFGGCEVILHAAVGGWCCMDCSSRFARHAGH